MKKIFIAVAVVLFTINVGAQDSNKTTAKKETCSMSSGKMTAKEKQQCEEKCKAEGKKCTAGEMNKKETKSCCAKKQ